MKKIIITILCLCLFVSVSHAKWKYNPFADNFDYYESGYDDLTEYVEQTAWSVFYSDGSGDITELTLGAEGKVLKAHGTAAPTWENDNNDGGATAWDDVSDPDNNGLTTIDFDNAAENTILAGSYDAAGSFFTLQSDDADVANQMYLLDLDYSVDDDQALADYFRCQDAGGAVFTIQQDGDTDIAGDLAVGSDAHSSISVNGTTKYIQFGVHGDDVADTYVSYMDRASDTHSPTMVIARGRGTHANPTQVADNDIIGQIGFMGWDDTDNDMNFGAKILARVHGAAGNNDLPTEIAFGVAPDGAATPTEQFSLYDGVIAPITDDDVDLGTSALQFKDGFFDGTLEADAITEGGNAVFNTTEGATFVGLNSSGAVNLDDGVGDSPTLSFLDADNNYFALIKYDAGAGGLFNNEGAIRLAPSNDTNDYVEFSTAAGVTTMATVAGGDDGDLVITAAGGEIGFGNENLSTTGTFEAATITEGGNAVYNSTDDLFIKLAGDVATAGTYDFGSASVVLEIPNAEAPTTNATGEMAIDTDVITQGMLTVYLASALAYVPACTDTPEDNEIAKYDSGTGTFTFEAEAGGGGGNTVYIEEGDAAKVDSSGADLYVDFDNGDFDVGVVGNEGNVTIAADSIGTVEMADEDHGDVNWSGGAAEVQTLTINDATSGTYYIAMTNSDTGSACLEYTDTPLAYAQATGTLSATEFSGGGAGLTAIDDDEVAFDDANGDWTATKIGPALEEMIDANGGSPNQATGKVNWEQLVNVPAGFADGTDADSGGATAWDDIGDPDNDGLTTIDFNHASENTILTNVYDAAGSFFKIDNTDANVANQMYLFELEYTDDGQVLADFFKCSDANGTIKFKIEEDGNTTIGDGSSGSVDFGTNTIDDDLAGNLQKGHISLSVQAAKITGNFVTQDDATAGAAIDAGEGGWRLLFDDTTDEGAVWQFRMPNDYDNSLVAKIQYTMATGTADQVELEVAVMAVSDGDSDDIVTPSFDTQNTGIATVPGTVGYLDEVSISLSSNDDSVEAGDAVWIQLSFDSDDAANDDATGDREIINFQLEYNRT